MKVKMLLPFCLLSLAVSADTVVRKGQTVRLWKGWNLVYLTVSPTEDANAVFGSWPVDRVAKYVPGAFNATQQYSSGADSEGLAPATMKMWYAGANNAESAFSAVDANGVYVVNCTNESFETTVWGEPHAARTVWHATNGDAALANYVGLAVDPAAGEVSVRDYMRGCTSGFSSVRRVSGYDATTLETEYSWGEVKASAGEALAFDATRATDWSGPVFVSPETGIRFGLSATSSSLTLRNDSGTNLTVRIDLDPPEGEKAPETIRGLKVRLPASEGGAWAPLSASEPYLIDVAAGASEIVVVALDRGANLPGSVGGILRLADASAGTHWMTSVPVTATIGSSSAEWQSGLWVADVTIDTASYVRPTDNKIVAQPAAGNLSFRLPVYVSTNGETYLLQRVDTYRDGKGETRYASGEEMTNDWTLVRRFSTVMLPVHKPVIAATDGFAAGTVKFAFTVEETSVDNPFRHVRNPEHDGLQLDFTNPAPSGDNLNNYLGAVKPELFSLTNSISLSWTDDGWTPSMKRTGRCRWSVGGLHAAGELFAEGDFVMQRRLSSEVIVNFGKAR